MGEGSIVVSEAPPCESNSDQSDEKQVTEPNSASGGIDTKFKCNICFESPLDPVVTVCGHMYCWRCLHAWLEHGSVQCPVCKAGVTRSSVIPVYGGGTEDTAKVHPASKEGQEAARKEQEKKASCSATGCSASSSSHSIPERPRAERPEPPPQTSSSQFGNTRGGWHAHNIQFGFFPFGVGVQFGGSGFLGERRGPPLTREQQRSQFVSTLLIILGVVVVFWSIFIESVAS